MDPLESALSILDYGSDEGGSYVEEAAAVRDLMARAGAVEDRARTLAAVESVLWRWCLHEVKSGSLSLPSQRRKLAEQILEAIERD